MTPHDELLRAIGSYLIFISGIWFAALAIYSTKWVKTRMKRTDKLIEYVEDEEKNRRL